MNHISVSLPLLKMNFLLIYLEYDAAIPCVSNGIGANF
jgi:hypothetical protein